MLKNVRTFKKLLPTLAIAAILMFSLAMRFSDFANSPKPQIIQDSFGDYFDSAYKKTLNFVQTVFGKVNVFTDQTKNWNQISQNLIKYVKEKPLVAAGIGAGIIWIPFGLYQTFRPRRDEKLEDKQFLNDALGEEDEEYQTILKKFKNENDENLEEDDFTEETEKDHETIFLVDDDSEANIFESDEPDFFDASKENFKFLDKENPDSIFDSEEENEGSVKNADQYSLSLDQDDEAISGSEKTTYEGKRSPKKNQLSNTTGDLSDIESYPPTEDFMPHSHEDKNLYPNILDLINKGDAVSNPDSEGSTFLDYEKEIDHSEKDKEIDQTLKDLQSEMEQTIQEISAQTDSKNQLQSETESEDDTTFDVSSSEEEISFENPPTLDEEKKLEEVALEKEQTNESLILEEEPSDLNISSPEEGSSLETPLAAGEEKKLEEVLLEKEQTDESLILEEEPSKTQANPKEIEETFKDTEVKENEKSTTSPQEEELEVINKDDLQKVQLTQSILTEERSFEFQDLAEESSDAFDPLLPALENASHTEDPKPKDRQKPVDPVKANSYIKSLSAFQRNLEKRLNTLRYFPPSEGISQLIPKSQNFEVEEFIKNEINIDFDQIGESSEKKYSLQLMESFILLDHQK